MTVTILVEGFATNVLDELGIKWRGCGIDKSTFVRADVPRDDAMTVISLVKEAGFKAMFDA